MPGKTTHDLFSKTLAELEQIIEHLELDADLLEASAECELDMTNLESSTDLTGLNVTIPPEK
jgi:hypothetical protein